MQIAPVSKLKASLSHFLAAVKVGGEIVVTERGRPIARIVPVSDAGDEEEHRLAEMEKRGLIRSGTGNLPRDFWRKGRPVDAEGRVRRALLKERHEGR